MNSKELVTILKKEKLLFITGVPCSYLKDFLEFVQFEKTGLTNIIATSEGEAVGIAAGFHLATGKVPVVYLQNSGFGNAINPLTSLMDKEVYSIPAILFLTWRGEPGFKDEPQHKKMGKVMVKLLEDLGIPYEFANEDVEKTRLKIKKLKSTALKSSKPVALIIRSGIVGKSPFIKKGTKSDLLTREEIIEIVVPKIGKHPIVTTTGKTSRELFELRERLKQSHKYDFLTVGSMGCAAGIGFGIATQTKEKVFVVDGDGAVLMKMGTLATIGFYSPRNFVHIIIDNGAYESTGGQPTVSRTLDWINLLKSSGYKNVKIAKNKKDLEKLSFSEDVLPLAVVVLSKSGSRSNLGRPTSTPIENKKEFMKFLSNRRI